MIHWGNALHASGRAQRRAAVKQIVTAQSYGFGAGQWTLTEMHQDNHGLKYDVYKLLDGVGADGRRVPNSEMKGLDGSPIRFRFQVLTRQACCRAADGTEITDSPGYISTWNPDAILAEHDDNPEAGDVVRWKGNLLTEDPDTGEQVTQATKRKWAMQNKPFHEMVEFIVDDDGCIDVPYPYALSMIQKFGANIASPRFRKTDRKAAKENPNAVRRIANWRFKDVPRDYTTQKSTGRKPASKKPSNLTDEPAAVAG